MEGGVDQTSGDVSGGSDVTLGSLASVSSEAGQSSGSLSKSHDAPKTKPPQRGARVVQSRYRLASSNNSSNGSSSSSNNSGRLNTTQRTKDSSAGKVTGVKAASHNRSGLKSQAKVLPKKNPKPPVTKTLQNSRLVKKTNAATSLKLHSTVINASVISECAFGDDTFSTTVVGGIRSNRVLPALSSQPDLPDISAIRLDSVSDITPKSETSIDSITAEELEMEYIRVLQAMYLNLSLKDSHEKKVEDAKEQLTFLEECVAEAEEEVARKTRLQGLLTHHARTSHALHQHENLLNPLIEKSPEVDEALTTMCEKLEKSRHQVKMENLYVPENQEEYRDKLEEALVEQCRVLDELEAVFGPQSQHQADYNALLHALNNTAATTQQCEREVNQAVNLAFQEASLLLGAHQTRRRTEAAAALGN